MLKFSFLDSQSDIHPLAAIFLIQNSIFNSIKDSNNEMHQLILSFIPILDKSQMSQLISALKRRDHVKDIIVKFHLPKRFDSNIIDSFHLTIKDTSIFPESLLVSISFASVIWYYDSSSRHTKDFEYLVSFLTGLVNCNPKINFIINYAFKKLLKGAVSCPNFKWEPTLFRIVFSHVFVNTSLDQKVFKQLINFFKVVVDYNHTDSMNEMMKLITTIVKEDRSIVNWDEIQLIIFLYMPFINSLDEQALAFISLISYKTKSSALSDTFSLLPSLLLNSLDFDDDDHQPFSPVPEFGQISVKKLPISFSHSSIFADGFAKPLISPFEKLQNDKSYLNIITINAIEKVSDCINNASMEYRIHFFNAFGKMFTILKNSNRYIQTCTAFVLLMEYTFQSVPIEIFLSILNETVLFQPEYNIYAFHGLDKMINFLRNRVFQMVIEHSTPSIASFLEKASSHPFLLTEHLNRLWFLKPEIFFEYFLDEKNANLFIQSALHLYFLENESAFGNCNSIINEEDRQRLIKVYDIKTARNDNFLVLGNICKQADLFTYEDFSNGLLWFMLEDDISYYILYYLRKGIASFKKIENREITPTVEFIIKVLLKAITVIKDDKMKSQQTLFNNLVVSLADSIHNSLMENPDIFTYFDPVFSLFFDILDLVPSSSLLESCFRMIEIFNQIEKWKPLDQFHFRILLKSIKMIEGVNISNNTFQHLYNLLCLCSNLTNHNNFLIKKPSFLPLLLFTFITANKTIDFFKHLNQLCDYSAFNAAACHDGGIDTIIIDYLINRKNNNKNSNKKEFDDEPEKPVLVNYCGNTLSLYFSIQELKTVIFPLLLKMLQVKSDNSICSKLTTIIGQNIDEISLYTCEQMIQVITQMKSYPVPSFRIGTFKPTLKFLNIPKNFFVKSKFIIKFDVELDSELISTSCTSLNLFSIRDEHDDNLPEIRLFTDQMSLLLSVRNNGIENIRYVVRIMPPSGWNTYEFHFSTNENTFSLCTFINDEEMNYFQNMKMPSFSSEKVAVSIGGFDKTLNKDWLNTDFGSISYFAIATTANTYLNDKNSEIKINDDTNSEFKDHFYLDNERYNVFCIMNDIDTNNDFCIYSEKNNGIKAFINFANIENRNNLLYYLIKGDFINSLINNFFYNFTDATYPIYIKLIFDILNQIIPITQYPLNHLNVDSIMHYLSSSIDLLDSNLFFCIYSIFDEISTTEGKKYSIRWFEKLLTNFWLWSRMKPADFKSVLYYFCHQFIFSHTGYFCHVSYFSVLFNQYYLMFCMKEDGVTHEYDISDFTIFRKEYSTKDIEECAELFKLLLNRIITLKVEQTDIETLFGHLFSSTSLKTILTIIHLLISVPSDVLRLSPNNDKHLSTLHKFLTKKYEDRINIELIEQVLILINKLAGDKIHQHFLVAVNELKILYFNKNNGLKINVIEFFKGISHYIYEYPNISIFLCIFTLNWHKSNNLDKTDRDNLNSLVCSILLLICNKKDSVQLFEFCEFWYIWPILLAYTLENNLRKSISFFLSKMLIHSPNPISEMDKIVDICYLITSTRYPKINLSFEFMKELCGIEVSISNDVNLINDSIETRIIRHSILRCFYIIFLHYTPNFVNNNIFVSKEIIESEMCPTEFEGEFNEFLVDIDETIHSSPITTPQEFEQLICTDFQDYKMRFKVRLDKKGQWLDQDKALFIISLLQKCKAESFDNKIEVIYKILSYFVNKKNYSLDQIIHIQSSFSSVFESLTEAYGSQFSGNISVFSKIFHQLMEILCDIRFHIDDADPDNYIKISHLYLEEEITRQTLSADIPIILPSILKRSNILASDFCPHLMKRTLSKEIIVRIPKTQPILELNCFRIKLNSFKSCIFRLYKDYFSLSGLKNIPLDDITMILIRKRSNLFDSELTGKEKESSKDKEKDTAIEIITVDGRSFLIDFRNVESSTVVRSFLEVPLPSIQYIQKSSASPSEVFNIPDLTHKWSQGLISNFEYLMFLNVFSGRSYNDERTYPLFPSILSDFDNPNMIRDFVHSFKFNSPTEMKRNLMNSLMEQQIIKPEFYFSSKTIMDSSIYLGNNSTRSLSLPLSESAYLPYLPMNRSSSHHKPHHRNSTIDDADDIMNDYQSKDDSDSDDFNENNSLTNLPVWAATPFEFVYKHRLLFESNSVNEYLGEWILDVFGPKMKSSYGHKQLFHTSNHPNRSIRPIVDLSDKKVQHFRIKNSKILASTQVRNGPVEFKFLFLLDNGSLISLLINTSSFWNPLVKLEKKISMSELNGRLIMSSFQGNSIILLRDYRKVINIKENIIDTTNLSNLANFNYYNNLSRNLSGSSNEYYLTTDTNFLFASPNGATFCPDETTIATVKFASALFYYSNNNNSVISNNSSNGNSSPAASLGFKHSFNYIHSSDTLTSSDIHDRSRMKIVWQTKEKIVLIEVSWRFKVAAFVTVDGFLHVGSIRNGSEVSSFDLKEFAPDKLGDKNMANAITITRNFGFIVLSMLDRFLIFSIDGDFIKQAPLPCLIPSYFRKGKKLERPKITEKVIKLFSLNKRGIDFVGYQNETFELKVFEAFYPEKVKTIYKTECKVICLEYDPASDAYLIVRESGRISLISSCI